MVVKGFLYVRVRENQRNCSEEDNGSESRPNAPEEIDRLYERKEGPSPNFLSESGGGRASSE